jgi:phosphatidylethanolamine-binding protein (PEBP) family uncharacterized protein
MKHVSRNPRPAAVLLATAVISLWGGAAMAMTLKSPGFIRNGQIPSKYTCEGEDVSPPLAWEGVPDGSKSLVLIIDDPDAPDPKAPKMVWVHWIVYRDLDRSEGPGQRPRSAAIRGSSNVRKNLSQIPLLHYQ